MKRTFKSDFATYYNGDPERIPAANLPAIVIAQNNASVEPAAFHQDDVTDEVVIKLILNKQDDYTGEVDPLNLTEKKLRDFVGARNAQTGQYLDKTVLGALRKYGTQGITAIAEQVSVEYGILPRSFDTDGLPDLITAEAHVTFAIQYPVDNVEQP
ncbi:hypothetical protein ACFZAD_24600 [Streptomyces iakyrus]|uniref:hypothetical protein n=1 Tax=Streptomyces iakyrus TaxID=68219 RepID=UPI0036E3F528